MLFLLTITILLCSSLRGVIAGIPDKIYGVNLGSWLVLEAWMLPQEWLDMGGEQCSDCSQCIATEFAFAQAYPDTVDEVFNKHWSTWFTQGDVNKLVDAGINTVRIPLGYWIVEALVDRETEFYPRGGIRQLQRGLKQLQAAGIHAILDHHALPGVQTAGQMFTGRCTSDVEFYTDANYQRALVWTAVMATLAHLDPSFGSVFSIEAVNEPIMDANQTPGYGDFQKNFVKVVRAVELVLGIPVPGVELSSRLTSSNFTSALTTAIATNSNGFFNAEVKSALKAAVPILIEIGNELSIPTIFDFNMAAVRNQRGSLVTNFMDVNWQHNNPSNPADAAIGPQGYDNHLYYRYGVADANPDAYLKSICNTNRVQADAALGNTPLWFGEWALSTQFNASDEFLVKWADAQKLAYSQSRGWIFWNFKVEISKLAGDLARQWSYFEAVERGYFTKDPSKFNDPHVCDAYKNTSTTNKAITKQDR
ncbi:glycoside hydrolase family 5 protein [Abortiporus biennis]|nr:glycoside hydrolase family 5 protein [Abortiporus biennis]